jgi:hypothetical protein
MPSSMVDSLNPSAATLALTLAGSDVLAAGGAASNHGAGTSKGGSPVTASSGTPPL